MKSMSMLHKQQLIWTFHPSLLVSGSIMGRMSGKSHKLNGKASQSGKSISAFKRGKKINIRNAVFDSRYLWKVKGVKGGVIVHWLQKPSREEEAFARKFFDDFRDNPQLLEDCGFDLLLSMRGVTGDKFRPQQPGSTWPWRILISCVGEEDNTPEVREEQANQGINLFNRTATLEHHRHPRNVRFAGDFTAEEMDAMDSMLLDKDVINLMQAAYPDKTLEVMIEDEELMADFWTDVERGVDVVREHINTHMAQETTGAAEAAENQA